MWVSTEVSEYESNWSGLAERVRKDTSLSLFFFSHQLWSQLLVCVSDLSSLSWKRLEGYISAVFYINFSGTPIYDDRADVLLAEDGPDDLYSSLLLKILNSLALVIRWSFQYTSGVSSPESLHVIKFSTFERLSCFMAFMLALSFSLSDLSVQGLSLQSIF